MEPAGKLSRAGLLVATIPEMINSFGDVTSKEDFGRAPSYA